MIIGEKFRFVESQNDCDLQAATAAAKLLVGDGVCEVQVWGRRVHEPFPVGELRQRERQKAMESAQHKVFPVLLQTVLIEEPGSCESLHPVFSPVFIPSSPFKLLLPESFFILTALIA